MSCFSVDVFGLFVKGTERKRSGMGNEKRIVRSSVSS